MRRLWISIVVLSLPAAGCPDNPMAAAEALEAQGNLREAAQAYAAIAKSDPANLPAWDRAVDLWCKRIAHHGECLGLLDTELDLLGNVTRHHEALSEVLERRARARLEQGLVDPAVADLDRALEAGPRRAGVHVARARAFVMLGARDRAIESLARAKEIDPANAEADEVAKILPAEALEDERFGGE